MSAPSKAPESAFCRTCGNPAIVSHDVRGHLNQTLRVNDCAACYGEPRAKAIFKALARASADIQNDAEYLRALGSAIDDLQGLEVDLGGAGWVPIIVPYFTLEQIAMHKRLDSRSPYPVDDVW